MLRSSQKLNFSYPEREGGSCCSIIACKRTHFGGAFNKYLCTFLEIRSNSRPVCPVSAIYPGCFFLVVALTVAVFFCMRNSKVDDILSIDCVDDAIFTKIADHLHFNHSAQN